MRSDPPTVGPHEKKLDFRYGRTTARNHSGRGMPCKHSQKRLPTNGYPNLQRKKRHAKIYNHQNSLRMEERKLDARESMELISRMIQKHPQPAGKPCGTPVPRMGLYDRRDRPAQLLVQHRRMPSRLVLHLVSHSHHRLSADAAVPGQEADGAPAQRSTASSARSG